MLTITEALKTPITGLNVIQGTIQPPDGDPRREGEAFARRGIVEMIDAMIADASEPEIPQNNQ